LRNFLESCCMTGGVDERITLS